MKGYKVERDTIVINRELTSLDLFVKDFLSILKKYSDYLIVSGFVSISTGRTRGTEDVDILFPIIQKEKFYPENEYIFSLRSILYSDETCFRETGKTCYLPRPDL